MRAGSPSPPLRRRRTWRRAPRPPYGCQPTSLDVQNMAAGAAPALRLSANKKPPPEAEGVLCFNFSALMVLSDSVFSVPQCSFRRANRWRVWRATRRHRAPRTACQDSCSRWRASGVGECGLYVASVKAVLMTSTPWWPA